MIESILDDDLYKFTMQQAVLETYPNAIAKYEFISRKSWAATPEFLRLLQQEVYKLKGLRLSDWERIHLAEACPFLKPGYLSYLADYKYDPNQLNVKTEDGYLKIGIEGTWHSTILWEVKLLALISECYFQTIDQKWNYDGQVEKIRTKGAHLNAAMAKFADFGTRRRRSFESQRIVVETLAGIPNFVGTSNVYLALKNKVKPIGTMAHEWLMGISGLESLRHANRYALNAWNQVYRGDLGIALTDTFGTEAFFEDFSMELAKLYDGVRHDSGCPFGFAERVVEFYRNLRIDPSTKTIVFSDGLDVETAIKLVLHCKNLGIRCSFGIGTNFTNDFENSPALNIVIKLRSIKKDALSRWIQVVKLSDVLTKATGDSDALRVAKYIFYGTPL